MRAWTIISTRTRRLLTLGISTTWRWRQRRLQLCELRHELSHHSLPLQPPLRLASCRLLVLQISLECGSVLYNLLAEDVELLLTRQTLALSLLLAPAIMVM